MASYMSNLKSGFEDDLRIWEHKVYIDPPALCDGDGPIGKLRKWYRQFYAPIGMPARPARSTRRRAERLGEVRDASDRRVRERRAWARRSARRTSCGSPRTTSSGASRSSATSPSPRCSTRWTASALRGPSSPSAPRRPRPTSSPSARRTPTASPSRPTSTRAAACPRSASSRAVRKNHPVVLARAVPFMINLPPDDKRLLPALRQVHRARPPHLRQHRHPRPARPRQVPGPDLPRRGLPLLPRAQARSWRTARTRGGRSPSG